MKTREISLPELGLIAGTRALGGVGLGLLLADRLPHERRKGVGWTLLLIGMVSTIPLVYHVLNKTTVESPLERRMASAH